MADDTEYENSLDDHPAGVAGGLGGLPIVDERTPGQDLRLIRRAVRNDWPISAELRARVMGAMDGIIADCPDPRSQVAAARVLIAADSINAKREQMDQAEELKKLPDLHLHHHAPPRATVRVIRDNNFYGNNAHDLTETPGGPES